MPKKTFKSKKFFKYNRKTNYLSKKMKKLNIRKMNGGNRQFKLINAKNLDMLDYIQNKDKITDEYGTNVEEYREYIENGDVEILYYIENTVIIGYIILFTTNKSLMSKILNDNEYYIHYVGINPLYRGKNLCRLLIREIINTHENINTFILDDASEYNIDGISPACLCYIKEFNAKQFTAYDYYNNNVIIDTDTCNFISRKHRNKVRFVKNK